MLNKCLRKVGWKFISFIRHPTYHPTCFIFIQHASPFILSFDVKSKMATEDGAYRHQLGSSDGDISWVLSKDWYAFKEMFWMSVELFKLISIWCAWFFIIVIPCYYYFAERFSFVKSFEIQSSNIQNHVMRMKCWMKQGINRSNVKIVLDEPENVGWKICSRLNFHPTRFFFIQHDFFFFCVLLNWSNISSNMAFLICWMKCWIGLTTPLRIEPNLRGKFFKVFSFSFGLLA